MEIHLILQLINVIAWIVVIVFLLINRKMTPINVFYIMLLASSMTVHSLVREVVRNDYKMDWNTWEWYPTNLVATLAYYLIIKSFSKGCKNEEWIPKKLKIKRDEK